MVSVLRIRTAGRRAVRLAEAVAERAAGWELRHGHQGDAGSQLQEPKETEKKRRELFDIALGKFRKNDIQGVCLQQACILKHCKVT